MFADIHKFNFYKYESEAKKGLESFKNYLLDIYQDKGTTEVIDVVKASGIAVSMFENPRRKEFFTEIVSYFKSIVNEQDLHLFSNLEADVHSFELLFQSLNNEKDSFFNQEPYYSNTYKVVSYLISLELFLNNLLHLNREDLATQAGKTTKSEIYDGVVESTGMLLSYFKHKGYPFTGQKRNISPKNVQLSDAHIFFSKKHEVASELLEYWQYSNVDINPPNNFKINDEEFEYAHMISNERFQNFRHSWQLSALSEASQSAGISEESYKLSKRVVLNRFATHYFGTTSLDLKIEDIELSKWLEAYSLLIHESEMFLKKRKIVQQSLNLNKVCIVKSKEQWIRYFQHYTFTKSQAEVIITHLTFSKGMQDLIDTPFIEIDDCLAIVPSLTSLSDASRALISNFVSRKKNLSFRGPGFEERIIKEMRAAGINASSLYKKIGIDEYECDIAFVLNNHLFFIECKAHLQPYTPRQHADQINKLFNETNQLHRIADFYEKNIPIVVEKLGLEDNFHPDETHRLIITTAMIGTPLVLNQVRIIDESAFSTFINRKSPELGFQTQKFSGSVKSNKFAVYKGEITVDKLIDFLKSPPAITITKEFFKDKTINLGSFNVTRKLLHNRSVNFGTSLGESDRQLMNKYFS